MSPQRFLERIRNAATSSRRVLMTNHVRDRMLERSITDLMVYEVLRQGNVSGEVGRGSATDEWKAKLVRRSANGRLVGVVVVLRPDERILIATAEWEDRHV